MAMLKLLIVLLLLSSTVVSLIFPPIFREKVIDDFYFNVTLVCHVKDFQFRARFLEVDSFVSRSDPITPTKYAKGHWGANTFELTDSLNGDELHSASYTPKMVLYHNCMTPGNKEVLVQVVLRPECPVGSKVCQWEVRQHISAFEGSAIYTSKIDVAPALNKTTST